MKPLADKEVKAVCQAVDYKNGEAYFRQGQVSDTWQTETSLHASVAGSGKRPYRVSITAEGATLTPKCTCPAHRRRPFCKHVAAVLVAWVRAPERFVAGEAPPAAPQPKPQSQVRRARKTRVDRRQVQLAGLAKVEELLVDLASYGLLALTEAQAALVADVAHTAESHKLRRLARLLARLGLMLEAARTGQEQVGPGQGTQAQAGPGQSARARIDELAYAELLSDAWLTAQATRRALEDPQADPTTLEELVGKTWREKDLERREGLRLLELAYESVELDTGFTMDTSYLFSLGDGVLYTEKQIVPTRLKNQPRKPSYSGLLTGTVGLYPGHEPRRIKLVEMSPEEPLSDADWQQALAHAGRSVAALFQQFQAATANPLAPPEAYALFAPARILVAGPAVSLLDGEGQAIAVSEGWCLVQHLARQPIAALFGRLALLGGALQFRPLGLITQPPGGRLLRLVTF